MFRDNRWWVLCFLLVPAVLASFVAGWQKARSDLPACEVCPCKEVTRWWTDDLDFTSANGAMNNGVFVTPWFVAQVNITSVSGSCKQAGLKDGSKYDQYLYYNCQDVCSSTEAQPTSPYEMTCSDSGVRMTEGVSGTNSKCKNGPVPVPNPDPVPSPG